MIIKDKREEGKDELSQAKIVMVKILRAFHQICEENNLQYWLDAGTLIGAIRHGGFIPWDDDIDIVMPRADYRKFIKIASQELPFDMFFQSRETDLEYKLPFVKIRDRYSTFVEENNKELNCHKGIFIDIFPVDFISKPRMHTFFHTSLHSSNLTSVSKYVKIYQKSVGRIIRKSLGKNHFSFCMFLNRVFSCSYKEATCLVYGMEINEINRYPTSTLFPLRKYRFEGYDFYVPNNYDTYLKCRYGDYMQLPPENERVVHNLSIYPFKACDHIESIKWENRIIG